MYKLVGTLGAFAMYNFFDNNLPFSSTLYKKLLKEKVDKSDLKRKACSVHNKHLSLRTSTNMTYYVLTHTICCFVSIRSNF